jgi:hypothetical protein
MSRYDELALKYATFCSRTAQADRIAIELARAVQSSLDAPADTVFVRAAAWGGGEWSLSPTTGAVTQLHRDGRRYFAICLRLRAGADANEQPTFAALLSVLARARDSDVRLEDTAPKFSVHIDDPGARADLVGEIVGVIEDALEPNPSGKQPLLNIGFVAAP